MPNLYNDARVRLLNGGFDWIAPNKYLVLTGTGFAFVPFHVTLDQTLPLYWQAQQISSLAITPTGWAGSPPVMFLNLTWPEPIWRAVLTEVSGDPLVAANHRLICDLDDIINPPFVADGRDKQVGFNTSLGAEGWFAP